MIKRCIICQGAENEGDPLTQWKMHGACWADRRDRPWHPEQYRFLLRCIYYAVLNEDSENRGFRSDLRALFEDFGPLLGQAGLYASEFEPNADGGPGLGENAPRKYGREQERLLFGHLNERPMERLNMFAETWRLPKDWGKADLWRSLRVADQTGHLALAAHFLRYGYTMNAISKGVVVGPALSFEYDAMNAAPRFATREVSRLKKELSTSLLHQVKAFDDALVEAGWARLPGRLRSPKKLWESATQFYRHIVAGWSPREIARPGYPPNARAAEIDTRAVRSSLAYWSEQLDIPLKTGGVLSE